MKIIRSFICAAVVNIMPLALCFFYDGGSPLLFFAFPLIHILLFMLNHKIASTWPQVITLGAFYVLVTFFTHLQYGWLYLYYICDDVIGRAIFKGGCTIGTGIAMLFSVASIVLFYRRQKEIPVNQTNI